MNNSSFDTVQGVELRGIGVSPGVAVAPAFLMHSEEARVVERDIAPGEIPREIARLEDALIATRAQLHDIQRRVNEAMGHESASIFDAHLLVVDDRSLVEEVIRGLSSRRQNVEAVLVDVAERYAGALAAVQDDYLRERAADIRDVTRRILRNLSGHSTSQLSELKEPCLLIANDLPPSETAVIDKSRVVGFATDIGSNTSHTAIMARALEIPAVVGLHDVSVRVRPGDKVLIDGSKGVLIINPTQEQLAHYGEVAEFQRNLQERLTQLRDLPAETQDAYTLLLSANIELPTDVPAVLRHGARGVGLFRSEFLYLASEQLPSEDEQTRAYEEVAKRLAPEPVVIRTLDLGGDKFQSHIKTPAELNPFMGWRAIRFCLAQPDLFKIQLRALLRASVHRNLKIMYPMICRVDEVHAANAMLGECMQELRDQGIPFNPEVEVGVMIEVPSAALTADLIAPHVKFFSIGTNDLVQYTLAVDRVNERIAELYEPTHPAILKLIKTTIDVGHEHGIWVGVCGEMAANPFMSLLLMGLGIDELSVSPPLVPMVKHVLRSVHYSQTVDLAERAVASRSGGEILAMCRDLVQSVDPEILALVE